MLRYRVDYEKLTINAQWKIDVINNSRYSRSITIRRYSLFLSLSLDSKEGTSAMNQKSLGDANATRGL